jgi:hypothetical protein
MSPFKARILFAITIKLFEKNSSFILFSTFAVTIFLLIRFFFFHQQFNLVRDQLWQQVVPTPSRSQLQGIKP